MSLRIIKAGIQDTVQDLGRYGYQQAGINPSGAMDRYALQVANALVGNDLHEAVLELHFPSSVILFTRPLLIAITGADFSPSINGEPVPLNQCIVVNKNDALQFHRPVSGARACLAVQGGFILSPWLESQSTNLKAAAGGYEGRSLRKGDELICRTEREYSKLLNGKNFRVLPWTADHQSGDNSKEILILPGKEWDRLPAASNERFLGTPFLITKLADRMGFHLGNEPLDILPGEELVSSAVTFGTIQLLPEGKLIILMADHQTTGGYPRVAHVITAHHSKLAQKRTGEALHFRITDLMTAEQLLQKQQQHIKQLQNACLFKLQSYA